MKIIVAPDSYKECLSAPDVAAIIQAEILSLYPDAEVVCCPMSDGGEGFAEIMIRALGGEIRQVPVTGPVGEPALASYGRVGDTAVMEAASACGLQLVPRTRRNPLTATSRGLGELILAAYGHGCTRMLVGVGGTATCDGGAGMMAVPGIRDICGKVSVEVLCDVTNPFLGPAGAARVYGPQKGATPQMIDVLEDRMRSIARTILEETGFDVSAVAGAGAGGGIGGALMAYFGAQYRSGADALMDRVRFEALCCDADVIITGEGRSDSQTLSGKVPFRVLRRSGDVPVILLSGAITHREALLSAGFRALIPVTPASEPLEIALHPAVAERNIRKAIREVILHRLASGGCQSEYPPSPEDGRREAGTGSLRFSK